MGERDHRAEVDLQHAVDLLGAQVREEPAGRQRGVGDQDVELAGLADEGLDLLAPAEVPDGGLRAELGGERLEHVGATAGDHELSAAGRAGTGDRLADPTGGAGDEHPSAEQLSVIHAAAVYGSAAGYSLP